MGKRKTALSTNSPASLAQWPGVTQAKTRSLDSHPGLRVGAVGTSTWAIFCCCSPRLGAARIPTRAPTGHAHIVSGCFTLVRMMISYICVQFQHQQGCLYNNILGEWFWREDCMYNYICTYILNMHFYLKGRSTGWWHRERYLPHHLLTPQFQSQQSNVRCFFWVFHMDAEP